MEETKFRSAEFHHLKHHPAPIRTGCPTNRSHKLHMSSFAHHTRAHHSNIFGLMASHDCPDSRSDFMTQIAAKFHLLIIVYIHLREAVMMKMIVTCRWPAMPADAEACFDEGYSQVGRLCKVECFAR